MDGTSFLFDSEPTKPSGSPREVRLASGATIYLKSRKPRDETVSNTAEPPLLDIDRLFARVEYQKTVQKSRSALREAKSITKQAQKAAVGNNATSAALWTEKYRPNTFIHLCSAGNDRLYRQILHWLKLWDTTVFNNASSGVLDPPERRILLIHGPTGTGKTVAAHILAQQLGYAIAEINAANSMDVAPGGGLSLKDRIQNALTFNSLASSGRPTCLLLDEIDSSANSNEIVRILASLMHRSAKKPVNRPIICIANDLYNGALEKIRPFCEYVAFRRPHALVGAAQRSVRDYLALISSQESLNLDSRSISEVIETCDADLRACINFLQFNRPVDGQNDESQSSRGLKDTQLSWFATVDRIFERKALVSREEAFSTLSAIIEGAGRSGRSMDKVVMGAFNRYLDAVHLQDDSLAKPAVLSDWLAFYDCCGPETNASATAVCMKMWSLFSDMRNSSKKVKEPLVDRNSAKESAEIWKLNEALLNQIKEQFPADLQVCGICQDISTITVPYLDRILNIGSTKDQTVDRQNVKKLAVLVKKLGLRLESHRDLETKIVTLAYAPEWESISQFREHKTGANKMIQANRSWLFPLVSAQLAKTTNERKRRAEEPALKKDEPKKRSSDKPKSFFQQYDELATQIERYDEHSEKTRTWVKYHEGFSNAVRKNIGWEEFFVTRAA